MDSTAAGAAAPEPTDVEVSLLRLYLMRALAIVFAISGFATYLPHLLNPDPTARGMTTAVLGAVWLLSFYAIRSPLQMLPIYVFEFVWKSLWLLAFGLPQTVAGRVDPQLSRDMIEIGLFSLVFGLVIPWRYVWRQYVKQPPDRWR